jgi:aromatic-L-amino-acid decarboxylase
MNGINDSGEFFLSHTKIDGRFVVRISIGNIRTERRHVERVWELISATARELDSETL